MLLRWRCAVVVSGRPKKLKARREAVLERVACRELIPRFRREMVEYVDHVVLHEFGKVERLAPDFDQCSQGAHDAGAGRLVSIPILSASRLKSSCTLKVRNLRPRHSGRF